MINNVSTIQIRLYPDGRMCAKDASDYVGLSEKTLAMMRCKGNGPRFIKRGRIFYFKQDLDEWLSKGAAISTAQCGKLNK
jgi:hypothetical protein